MSVYPASAANIAASIGQVATDRSSIALAGAATYVPFESVSRTTPQSAKAVKTWRPILRRLLAPYGVACPYTI